MYCGNCKGELPLVSGVLTKHKRHAGVPLHRAHLTGRDRGENAHQVPEQPGPE